MYTLIHNVIHKVNVTASVLVDFSRAHLCRHIICHCRHSCHRSHSRHIHRSVNTALGHTLDRTIRVQVQHLLLAVSRVVVRPPRRRIPTLLGCQNGKLQLRNKGCAQITVASTTATNTSPMEAPISRGEGGGRATARPTDIIKQY